MNELFSPFAIKGLSLKNRIVMSPMCQYSVSAKDGIANDWHYVHYVSRAIGGAGLILLEMTDVEPDGRISDYDLGLWSDEQIAPLQRIVEACQRYGAKVGVQIAHAGRKAQDAAVPVAPSAIAFDAQSRVPHALTTDEVKQMVEKFGKAVSRAVRAGFDTIELHGAHGYLLHQFHSALTNRREDAYGQELTRFGREVVQAAKAEMPAYMPLMMRISASEYAHGGYGITQSKVFAQTYRDAGVDLFDVSSGGEAPIPADNRPGTHAAYQTSLSSQIKEALGVPTMAVGRLENPVVANAVIGNAQADLIAVGRGMLRDPHWALNAAVALQQQTEIPTAYTRGY